MPADQAIEPEALKLKGFNLQRWQVCELAGAPVAKIVRPGPGKMPLVVLAGLLEKDLKLKFPTPDRVYESKRFAFELEARDRNNMFPSSRD